MKAPYLISSVDKNVFATAQRQLLTYIAGILNDHAIGLTHISLTK